MVINIIKDSKSDSKQPVVYDLGTITTTLQDLLDNSRITITDKQVIILKVTNLDTTVNYYFIPFKDYRGESLYGYGKEIVVADLIPIGTGGSSIPTTNNRTVELKFTTDGNYTFQAGDENKYIVLVGTGGTNVIYTIPEGVFSLGDTLMVKILNPLDDVINYQVQQAAGSTIQYGKDQSLSFITFVENTPGSNYWTFNYIQGNSSNSVESGNFLGTFKLDKIGGNYYNDVVQSGTLTLSAAGSAVVGGTDCVKITANGSAITIPGSWKNIGNDSISTNNGDVNRIIVTKTINEIWYTVKVN